MHPELQVVFAPVMRDLGTADLPVPDVSVASNEDVGQWAEETQMVVRIDGAMFPLTREDSDADRVVALADSAQEWLIENVLAPGRRDTNWPICPQHPNSHPLAPRNDRGRPIWACPVNGVPIVPIGELRPGAPTLPSHDE